jgi:hypothetical protein
MVLCHTALAILLARAVRVQKIKRMFDEKLLQQFKLPAQRSWDQTIVRSAIHIAIEACS